jgi:D-glycero-D-manno-heptose 1,7-bisphosphate phosphatase
MAERAIFLDRDNTIIANDGYLGDPSQVKLMQGAATAIAAMRRLGYRIIVASNQSGVARGMFDEAAVEAVNQEMCRQLREQAGAHIDASYYCPYHPEAVVPEYRVDHEWRKPKSGMLKQAAEDFGLDLQQCWMIGDMPRDIAAGATAGCRTIMLRDPEHPAPANESDGVANSPNFIVKTLADAARIVVREGRHTPRDVTPQPTLVHPSADPAPNSPITTDQVDRPTPAAAIDSDALAQKIAAAIAPYLVAAQQSAGTGSTDSLRPVLDEIAKHLRHADRARDMPEFSLMRLVAGIVQFLVPVLLILGAWVAYAGFTTIDPEHRGQEWYFRTISLMTAALWILGAGVLQGIVIALTQHQRQR